MSKLQNNFTTPEQSKRLLELGVPADSADCIYLKSGKIDVKNTALDELFPPCWSVGRLIEILEIIVGTPWSDYQVLGKSTLLERVLRDFEDVVKYKEIFKDNRIDFSKLEE